MSYRIDSAILFSLIVIVLLCVSGSMISLQALAPSQLIISEFLAANNANIMDDDGDHSDWIEIYNRSNKPINLSGWALTNDLDDPQKWMFPNITLDSHAYMVVFASGKNRSEIGETLHTNFKLSRDGDVIALYNVLASRYMDVIDMERTQQFQNISFGRDETLTVSGYLIEPSPGATNGDRFVGQEFIGSLAAPSPSSFSLPDITPPAPNGQRSDSAELRQIPQITISELMYNPIGGDDYEFIELRNVGETAINMAAIQLEGVEFIFPYSTPPLRPGQATVLVHNQMAFTERYPNVPIAGVYQGQLSNKGETISVRDTFGQLIISITYDDDNGWPLSADGHGDSIELTRMDAEPNSPISWHASEQLHGTPGQ